MSRSYLTNLSFRNDPTSPIVDNENIDTKWYMCVNGEEVETWGGGLDFSNPSFLGGLDKSHTSMTVTTPNTYIMADRPIKVNPFSLAIRYRIPEQDIYQLLTELEEIPIMKWDTGKINIMDYTDEDHVCIGVTVWDKTYKGPIHYETLGYDQPVQLVITIDGWNLKAYINGNRIIDVYASQLITSLSNLCIGNCGNYRTELQIDEVAITDTIESPNEFTTKPYHSIYPENDEVEVVKRRRVNTVSEFDRINLNMDIVRHSDYTPPKSYSVDRVRRYRYDNESEG